MTKLGGIEMFKNKIKPGIRGVIIERNETSAGRKVGEWVHIGGNDKEFFCNNGTILYLGFGNGYMRLYKRIIA